jgi:RNA methyltransferase, TrmH family
MITSPHNEKLKLIRKLHQRKHRERSGLLVAEGEDLVDAASAAGVAPEFVLVAGTDVESALLDEVSELGSVRAAHALADGPVVVGPGCADPYSPRAVRASMGSVFARPPARAALAELDGLKLALDPRAERTLAEADLTSSVVICLGAEREGLPADVESLADATARIPMRADGPESLNVAGAAAVALYELANRMADRA